MSVPTSTTSGPQSTDAIDIDPTAEERKSDHIRLAFESQVKGDQIDTRFSYEPLLAAHPQPGSLPATQFAGFTLRTPMWVSSMTGGTEKARVINRNLARACKEFGFGMGLGSCRPLLYSQDRLEDFDMRPLIGDKQPLFANLGIAQLETLIVDKEMWRVEQMLERLKVDGLIIHVNPLQEWLQPEGDRFLLPPLETIQTVLEQLNVPIIVKEVGQGMGIESLKALLRLPLAAVEFAAGGGTNFSKLELLRADPVQQVIYDALTNIGHSAAEMVELVNQAKKELRGELRCKDVIISGGVKDFLDGYFLRSKCDLNSVYGQASGFLKYATGDYEPLQSFVTSQVRGLELAHAFLKVR
ncbi:MAG: isopentenyl-diphosphate delta-isomerase [Saprospiraceae bacterium]